MVGVTYPWHMRSILVFDIYMVIMHFLAHDGELAINDTITFLMLKRIFSGIIWLLVTMVVPLVASVSCAIDNNTIGILNDGDANGITSVKCHVAPHLDHLDIRNTKRPLMIPSASPDANASANGIIWWKRLCYTLFESSWCEECNGDTGGANGITWHLCWSKWYHMIKSNVAAHFDYVNTRNAMVLLVMLSASCDTNAGANGVKCSQK